MRLYPGARRRQDNLMSERSDDVLPAWATALSTRIVARAGRHPLGIDLTIAVGAAVVSLLGLHSQDRLGTGSFVICILLCGLLPLRRRDPFLCFAAIALVAFAQWLVDVPQLADVAILISLYWVTLEASPSQIALAAVGAETGAILATLRWAVVDPAKVWVGLSGLMVAAAVLGIVIRQRRALLLSLQERAARLEVERDQEGRLGAAAERARIAREMHDIVSHNLTVMIALADGASYAMESAPEQALPAIHQVSATGRQALLEMRRLLGVLRDEPGQQPLEPQPTIARLDELVARVEAAGIPVSVDIDGDPRGLGDGVQLTVFRVAQEALTNTLKHAVEPSAAHIRLRCTASTVELEVSDDGQALATVATGRPGSGAPGGRGLPGMRERATAYGGELSAGPRPQGGWSVRLRLTVDVAESPGG
jgi:signal transduction histidine kinase